MNQNLNGNLKSVSRKVNGRAFLKSVNGLFPALLFFFAKKSYIFFVSAAKKRTAHKNVNGIMTIKKSV